MDVSFIVVANPVKCSASFSSGWTTTALVEVDSIKALKKHSVEEEQDPAGVPLVPEDEEEGVAVEAQMNRPPPEKEKQENAGIAAKKAIPGIVVLISNNITFNRPTARFSKTEIVSLEA